MLKILFLVSVFIFNLNADLFQQSVNYSNQGNYKKSEYFAKQACDKGDGKGCFLVGMLHDGGKNGKLITDKSIAGEYYMKACNYGEDAGCFQLAAFYYYGQGNIPKSRKKSMSLFKILCSHGNKRACINYTKMTNGEL